MIDLNKYPKAKEKFIRWTADKYELVIGRKIEGQNAERFAESSLQGLLRSLFSFFDEQEIYVVIDYVFDRIDAPEWFFRIYGDKYDVYYPSRSECEEVAFNHAFQILEERRETV